MSRFRTLAAITAVPSVAWRATSAAARRVRGIDREGFIPPWEASVLEDTALNRPLNLVFRLLRWKVALRARLRIPGVGLRPGVTIAIVNWNSMDLLRDVLRAIETFGGPTHGVREVLVIDNGSTDGSRQFLRACRSEGRVRCLLLPQNIYHGPAMDLAFLLTRTEFVVALDVDAFPIAPGWLETLTAPLRDDRTVSGAEAARGYIHPCCLAMRTAHFASGRHTFTPHIGTWDPSRRGFDEWDTGEAITLREGAERIMAFPRTRVRGPLQLGSVFGDFVYHNGASTRLRSDIKIDGLTLGDAERAWLEAVAEHLDGAPAGTVPASEPVALAGSPSAGEPSVTVHVATLNTAHVTELCIRSMRRYAGRPFDLVVGDAGSNDGSVPLLRAWEAMGWLTLQEAAGGRTHADWIDGWIRACPSRFAVFSDSDVEYREPGWLSDIVATALETGAALVCGRMLNPSGVYVHPVTGATRRLANRPSPWLLLLDLDQVRGVVDATFQSRDVKDPESHGVGTSFDVGAMYFDALVREGLSWKEMPPEWRTKFRHYGGLTWLKNGALAKNSTVRARQIAKLGMVEARLRRARIGSWGNVDTATVPPVAGSSRAS